MCKHVYTICFYVVHIINIITNHLVKYEAFSLLIHLSFDLQLANTWLDQSATVSTVRKAVIP